MRRFFYNSYQYRQLTEYNIGEHIVLTDSIHHHWCRVLRAKIADQALLFDGFGGEYLVELTDIQKKISSVCVLSYHNEDRGNQFSSEIGLVMSRGDRMDYAIQKATELGVTAIQLLTSHHGELRLKPAQVDKKLAHWQQVAISACEQCGFNRVPIILSPLPVQQWLSSFDERLSTPCDFIQPIWQDGFYHSLLKKADIALVLNVPDGDQPMHPPSLTNVLKNHRHPFIQLLIGSEGGLNDEEIKQAKEVGFESWQIGERVLRTETAPVVALATLNALKNC